MCGWMRRDCGFLLILSLSFLSCQGKSFLPHEYPMFQGPPPQSSPTGILDLSPSQQQQQQPGEGDGRVNYQESPPLPPGATDMGSLPFQPLLDDGNSLENSLFNYLATKNMIRRMKQQIEANTLSQQQRKRNNGNYWKMCAFNAVSCFG